jgi:hypothetical protein
MDCRPSDRRPYLTLGAVSQVTAGSAQMTRDDATERLCGRSARGRPGAVVENAIVMVHFVHHPRSR